MEIILLQNYRNRICNILSAVKIQIIVKYSHRLLLFPGHLVYFCILHHSTIRNKRFNIEKYLRTVLSMTSEYQQCFFFFLLSYNYYIIIIIMTNNSIF